MYDLCVANSAHLQISKLSLLNIGLQVCCSLVLSSYTTEQQLTKYIVQNFTCGRVFPIMCSKLLTLELGYLKVNRNCHKKLHRIACQPC
jgi:hypothetical protein